MKCAKCGHDKPYHLTISDGEHKAEGACLMCTSCDGFIEFDDASFQAFAREVEREWQMGGLSHGLYYDYAREVARRYLGLTHDVPNPLD